jgi:hypothetical protein
MRYFVCNAPGTIGYSVAFSASIIVAIHAHGRGDNARGYQDVMFRNHSLFWMYMPVEQDEYITEIYKLCIQRWAGRSLQGTMVRPKIGLMVRILSLFIYVKLTTLVRHES